MKNESRLTRPRAADTRVRPWQVTLTLVAAIFIVSIMLYGINQSEEPGSRAKNPPRIAVTAPAPPGQPAQENQQTAQRQGQSQQPGGSQPSATASPAQSSGASNPATTTGQGNNVSQGNGKPNPEAPPVNTGGNSNSPAGAAPSGRAPGPQ
jgi:hypothetical protein